MIKKALFNVKMHATGINNKHISGAEKIVSENLIYKISEQLIKRAKSHSIEKAININISIKKLDKECQVIESLPAKAIKCDNYVNGLNIAKDLLQKIGITQTNEIFKLFKQTKSMRGAILLHTKTLKRLEPDLTRGIRASCFDTFENINKAKKDHYIEAITLSSKVLNNKNIIAELCVSDDPNYVSGYVASKQFGYIRIKHMKKYGSNFGGRIFFFKGNKKDIKSVIKYLETEPILVKNIPPKPNFN